MFHPKFIDFQIILWLLVCTLALAQDFVLQKGVNEISGRSDSVIEFKWGKDAEDVFIFIHDCTNVTFLWSEDFPQKSPLKRLSVSNSKNIKGISVRSYDVQIMDSTLFQTHLVGDTQIGSGFEVFLSNSTLQDSKISSMITLKSEDSLLRSVIGEVAQVISNTTAFIEVSLLSTSEMELRDCTLDNFFSHGIDVHIKNCDIRSTTFKNDGESIVFEGGIIHSIYVTGFSDLSTVNTKLVGEIVFYIKNSINIEGTNCRNIVNDFKLYASAIGTHIKGAGYHRMDMFFVGGNVFIEDSVINYINNSFVNEWIGLVEYRNCTFGKLGFRSLESKRSLLSGLNIQNTTFESLQFMDIRLGNVKIINMLSIKPLIMILSSDVDHFRLINLNFRYNLPTWLLQGTSTLIDVSFIDFNILDIQWPYDDRYMFPECQFLSMINGLVSNVHANSVMNSYRKPLIGLTFSNVVYMNSTLSFFTSDTTFLDSHFSNVTMNNFLPVSSMKNVSFVSVRTGILTERCFEIRKNFELIHTTFDNLNIVPSLFSIIYVEKHTQISVQNVKIMNSDVSSIFKMEQPNQSLAAVHIDGLLLNSVLAKEGIFKSSIFSGIGSFLFVHIHISDCRFGTVFSYINDDRYARNSVIISDSTVISSNYSVLFSLKENLSNTQIENCTFIMPLHSALLHFDYGSYFGDVYIKDSKIFLPADSVLIFEAQSHRIDRLLYFYNLTIDKPNEHRDKYQYIMYTQNMVFGAEPDVHMDGLDRLMSNTTDNFNTTIKRIGLNSISRSSIAIVMRTEMMMYNLVYVIVNPFSFGVVSEKGSTSVRLPIYDRSVIERNDLRIAAFDSTIGHNRGVYTIVEKTQCMSGFGWNSDLYLCEPCALGYHQFEIVNEPRCKLNKQQAFLSDLERSRISGVTYSVPHGQFVVENIENGTTNIIDCHNTFCNGFQVHAGFSGLCEQDLTEIQIDLLKFNNLSIYDINGCSYSHCSIACTDCGDMGDVLLTSTGFSISATLSFKNVFSKGCFVIPTRGVFILLQVAFLHFLLVSFIVRKYHILGQFPWTRIIGRFTTETDLLTDYELFKFIDIFKDYLFILWPLLFSFSTDTIFTNNQSDFTMFRSLLMNPLAVFASLLGLMFRNFPVTTFPTFYILWFFLMRFLYFKRALLTAIVAFIIFTSFTIVPLFIFLGSLFLLIYFQFVLYKNWKRWPFYTLCFIWFTVAAYYDIRYSAVTGIVLFACGKGYKVKNIMSINFFFLPYAGSYMLLGTIPVVSRDLYNQHGFDLALHSFLSFKEHYNWFINPLLMVIFVIFIIYCYWETKKLTENSSHRFHVFFYVTLILRMFVTFIAYISHNTIPHLIFLLCILLYVMFYEPFKQLNALMVRVTALFVLTAFILVIFRELEFLEALLIAIPSFYFVNIFKKQESKGKSSSILQDVFDESLLTEVF
ncbi:hypothetical protein PCE1_000337 [Barthelona sp. PCE]